MGFTDKPIQDLLLYNGSNLSNAVYDSVRHNSDHVNELNQPNKTTNSSQTSALIFMVAPFSLIFLFCVIGNLLVIATLVINRRMRTAFNAFLLNLAIADLLLGLFCMPFTLFGFVMKEFIFGALMCRLIPYLQAVSVSVSSWTLVTMSVERYYATCQPLKSKSNRQNWNHVFKVIGGVWLLSFIVMSPIAYLSKLMPTNENKMKCRENWPSDDYLIFYTFLLNILIFLIPLLIMMISYFLIALKFILMNKQHENLQFDGKASYHTATRQSSINVAYAYDDTPMGGSRSQTDYSLNSKEKSDCPLVDHGNNSPLHLKAISRRHSGNNAQQACNGRTQHHLATLNSYELLSTKDCLLNRPKAISFSGSLEKLSLDHQNIDKLPKTCGRTPTSPMPSAFNGGENSPKNLKTCQKEGLDSNSKSPAKIDNRTHRFDHYLSLRKNDKNNIRQKARKSSSLIINRDDQYRSSSNKENVLNSSESAKLTAVDKSTLTAAGGIVNKEITAMKLRSNLDRRLAQKRQSKVIKILAILVLEFFTCWCPLHIINLISLYKPKLVYQSIGYDALGLFFLLAYSSSCTNPITYCFMNYKFRQSFLNLFSCSGSKTGNNPKPTWKPRIRSVIGEL